MPSTLVAPARGVEPQVVPPLLPLALAGDGSQATSDYALDPVSIGMLAAGSSGAVLGNTGDCEQLTARTEPAAGEAAVLRGAEPSSLAAACPSLPAAAPLLPFCARARARCCDAFMPHHGGHVDSAGRPAALASRREEALRLR